MSKIRVDQVETLDSSKTINISDIVDGSSITTSTGEQTLVGALDQRVIYVDTIDNLQALNTSGLVDGQAASVQGSEFTWSSVDSEWQSKNIITIDAFGNSANESDVLNAIKTKSILDIEGAGNVVTLYCDPVNGDDGNLGDSANPVKTIQEAVERIPKRITNIEFVIDMASMATLPATYDEDVVIQNITARSTGGGSTTGRLTIIGDWTDESTSTPSNVKIGSLTVVSCYGLVTPRVLGARMMRVAPLPGDTNENAAIQSINSSETSFWDIEFDDNLIDVGVLAYNSSVDLRRVDSTNIKQTVVHSKRKASVTCKDFLGTFSPVAPLSFIGGRPFGCSEGGKIWYDGSELTTGGDALGWGAVTRFGGKFWHVSASSARGWSDEFKYFGVFISGFQSVNYDISQSSGVWNRVQFDTAFSDDLGQFGSNRLFIGNPTKGIYLIQSQVTVEEADLVDGASISLRIKDGEGTVMSTSNYSHADTSGVNEVSFPISCTVDCSDAANSAQRTFEVEIRFSGTGARTIIGDRDKTWLSATRFG